MKNFKTLSLIGLTSISLLLGGCFDSSSNKEEGSNTGTDDNQKENILAVIQSVDTSGMVEFTNGIDKVLSGLNETTATDYTVFTNGNFYYHLGKFQIDTIQKYHIDSPAKGYYSNNGFSLRSVGDTDSANPYNMVFLNDSQAIITRHGATSAWVVNLDAKNSDEFLIKELDLSIHATGEGDSFPEMDMVYVYKNKAFITLQNLTDWNSTGNEKVVVYNTKTWQEVDTDPSQEGIQAIKLSLTNHQTGTKVGNKLYLGSIVYPDWGSTDPATGGIEVVNLDNYSVEVITEDIGINILTSTNSGKVFFTSYEAWQENTLYKLNSDKSYSKVSPELESKNISALSAIEEALWLGYSAEGHYIMRIDARNDFSVPRSLADIRLSQIETALKPIKIDFIKTNDDIANLVQE